MNCSAEIKDYKGKSIIELVSGKYTVWIAPFCGSNVMRMQDTDANIEVFRFDENLTPEELVERAEVYGMPTLYLPNRLSNGLLKVSDCSYHFPINDPLGNHIHGFLHKLTASFLLKQMVQKQLQKQNISTMKMMSFLKHIR